MIDDLKHVITNCNRNMLFEFFNLGLIEIIPDRARLGIRKWIHGNPLTLRNRGVCATSTKSGLIAASRIPWIQHRIRCRCRLQYRTGKMERLHIFDIMMIFENYNIAPHLIVRPLLH
jgi:hypothetical protein